jgi:hypothetical protein
MKKNLILLMALVLLVGTALPSSADNFPLVANTWVVLDENMTAPAFFTGGGTGTGHWTWTGPGALKVTDLFVATDRFNLYDNDVLVATFAGGTDWDVLGAATPTTDPPYTTDPDVAWTRDAFAKGTYVFGVGSHAFSFEDIHIPPLDTGGPYPDGTIAFQAVPLPSTLILLGPGLLGLLGWRRFRQA